MSRLAFALIGSQIPDLLAEATRVLQKIGVPCHFHDLTISGEVDRLWFLHRTPHYCRSRKIVAIGLRAALLLALGRVPFTILDDPESFVGDAPEYYGHIVRHALEDDLSHLRPRERAYILKSRLPPSMRGRTNK